MRQLIVAHITRNAVNLVCLLACLYVCMFCMHLSLALHYSLDKISNMYVCLYVFEDFIFVLSVLGVSVKFFHKFGCVHAYCTFTCMYVCTVCMYVYK